MKKLLLIFSFLPLFAFAQFNDNFSDGDFSSNPTWMGQTTNFIVDTAQKLQLNASGAGNSYLSTSSQAIQNAIWEFQIEMKFNPSSSNFAHVYLVSNQSDLSQNLNGYFVKIGNTSDEISLYRQDGSNQIEIIDGQDDRVDLGNVQAKIRVTRDSLGNWELFSDTSLAGGNFVSEGSVFDDTHFQSQFFGVHCFYTSTRSDKFFFDDFQISGNAFMDNLPPEILQLNVVSANEIDLIFSESITQTTAEDENNYLVNNSIGNPQTAILTQNNQVSLSFANAFPNGLLNEIIVQNIEDLFGNTILPDTLNFANYEALKNDIIFTEIFPDPEPKINLPIAEFVEIYNRSDFPINLKDWTLADATSSKTLPDYDIQPKTYLILCSESNLGNFLQYGNVLALSSFPSLNNSADDLILKDENGNLIDFVRYSETWYQDNFKQNGGWTLERIDLENLCEGMNNWRASEDLNGGTPGKENSIKNNNPDQTKPELLRATIALPDTIVLLFSETLDEAISTDILNYEIDNNIGNPQQVLVLSPDFQQVKLVLANPLQTQTEYLVEIKNLTDCAGNQIIDAEARLGIPEPMEIGDLIINEILFDPRTGGKDFVEIYNRSEKVIDLKDLLLANTDELDQIKDAYFVVSSSYLFFPKSYLVFSQDVQNIKNEYFVADEKALVQMTSFPSLPSDFGSVVLLARNNQRIDQVNYSENWHFQLIDNPDGVSLERISFDLESQDSTNWFSAASVVGYATPTYKNSQFNNFQISSSSLEITPKTFSPNQDGMDDLLFINYNLESQGFTGTIKVFDVSGRLIKNILQNELLQQSGRLIWDGSNENGEKPRSGAYILFFEAFNLSGKTVKFKKGFVLQR